MAEEGQQHFPIALVKQQLGRKEQICWRRKDAECFHMGWVSACAHVRGKVHFAGVAFPGIAVHLVNKSLVTPPCRAPQGTR